jgi:hypothetical protein
MTENEGKGNDDNNDEDNNKINVKSKNGSEKIKKEQTRKVLICHTTSPCIESLYEADIKNEMFVNICVCAY